MHASPCLSPPGEDTKRTRVLPLLVLFCHSSTTLGPINASSYAINKMQLLRHEGERRGVALWLRALPPCLWTTARWRPASVMAEHPIQSAHTFAAIVVAAAGCLLHFRFWESCRVVRVLEPYFRLPLFPRFVSGLFSFALIWQKTSLLSSGERSRGRRRRHK